MYKSTVCIIIQKVSTLRCHLTRQCKKKESLQSISKCVHFWQVSFWPDYFLTNHFFPVPFVEPSSLLVSLINMGMSLLSSDFAFSGSSFPEVALSCFSTLVVLSYLFTLGACPMSFCFFSSYSWASCSFFSALVSFFLMLYMHPVTLV